MDMELAQAAGKSPQAVLGLMEFKVKASRQVGPVRVCRTLVVRRQYRVSDPIGPCATPEERLKIGLLPSMVHVNPLDLYRDVERQAEGI